MRVEIYRNLRTRTFSIRQAGGRVQKHSNYVLVHKAEFVVQPAGREKVLRTRQKNVHAFVRGEWDDLTPLSRREDIVRSIAAREGLFRLVSYNPYKAGYFYHVDDGTPCDGARCVWLLEGSVYVPGPGTLELIAGVE